MSLHLGTFGTFGLDVTRSRIHGAGDGVINWGKTIPVGVLFGPYGGQLYTPEAHKLMVDSGNAWKIVHPQTGKNVGFIDPGVVEDSVKYWMAKVNCADKSAVQNLVSFQYRQQIYYR